MAGPLGKESPPQSMLQYLCLLVSPRSLLGFLGSWSSPLKPAAWPVLPAYFMVPVAQCVEGTLPLNIQHSKSSYNAKMICASVATTPEAISTLSMLLVSPLHSGYSQPWVLYIPSSKTLKVDLGSLWVFSARGSMWGHAPHLWCRAHFSWLVLYGITQRLLRKLLLLLFDLFKGLFLLRIPLKLVLLLGC